ncbi:MAG TPA: transposase [Anaeromyxobacteraceae bacterium]|nr:transposase [Anaeromyxobacteraceae bacterium]
MTLRSMRANLYWLALAMHALHKLHHSVFQCRFRCLGTAMLELRASFSRLLERRCCEFGEFNGEPDHVHLLLRMHPAVKPSVSANNLKTRRDPGKEQRRAAGGTPRPHRKNKPE